QRSKSSAIIPGVPLIQFQTADSIIVSATKKVIRHCERSEAIHVATKKEWIASRSLSSGAHSRDPLARNDGRSAG
ncbi:MAG: hypothetical protein ACRECG_02300, partial [Bradyrhizobium sp.]